MRLSILGIWKIKVKRRIFFCLEENEKKIRRSALHGEKYPAISKNLSNISFFFCCRTGNVATIFFIFLFSLYYIKASTCKFCVISPKSYYDRLLFIFFFVIYKKQELLSQCFLFFFLLTLQSVLLSFFYFFFVIYFSIPLWDGKKFFFSSCRRGTIFCWYFSSFVFVCLFVC